MNVIDTLITDRTQADVINRTPLKCAADYVCLNRVEQACAYIAENLGVSIQTKTWNMEEWRKESEMTRIRNNIDTLINAFYVKSTTPNLTARIRYETVKEANDIETILRDIDDLYNSMIGGKNRLSFRLGSKTLGVR